MTSDVVDAEMNRNELCAMAAGWTEIRRGAGFSTGWKDGDKRNQRVVPNCERSLDACFLNLWPVLVASGKNAWSWESFGHFLKDAQRYAAEGSTPAIAFCDAFLAVMGEK